MVTVPNLKMLRIVAVVLAVATALVVAEVAVRLLWQPAIYVSPYRLDPRLHHRARALTHSFQILETGRHVEIITNSLGLRDREYGSKQPDAFRILELGDSYTEASTSPLEETSAKLLESKLRAALPDRKIEVINAGQVSYSPLLEYMFLKTELLSQLQPDLVLLNLDMTDVQDDFFYARVGEFDENGEPLAVPQKPVPMVNPRTPPPSGKWGWLTGKSRLAALIETRAQWTARSYAARMVEPGDIFYDRLGTTRDEVTSWGEHYERTAGYLVKIRDLLAERGIPLVIFVYPTGHQVAADEWAQGRIKFGFDPNRVYTGSFFPFLAEYCPAHSLDCRLLLDDFRARRNGRALYLSLNGHFTGEGEKLLAELQYETLIGGDYLNRPK